MGTRFAKLPLGDPAMRKLSQRLATLSIPLSLFGIPDATSAVSAFKARGTVGDQFRGGLAVHVGRCSTGLGRSHLVSIHIECPGH
jgi:hypothetical protein